jgi:uncharacterized damage-inducible protein DinB
MATGPEWIPRESQMITGTSITRTKGPTMNEPLLDALRHNIWATKHLLVFCQSLSEEQLISATPGTSRDIPAIFNHFILSDAAYLRRLAGSAPAWVDGDERADLDQLKAWVEETEPLWEQCLSQPIDTERVIVVDDGANEVRAGIFVAQALHHGNAHREQICAILTGFGIEPPDVQPWEYAWATGRIWERTATG